MTDLAGVFFTRGLQMITDDHWWLVGAVIPNCPHILRIKLRAVGPFDRLRPRASRGGQPPLPTNQE